MKVESGGVATSSGATTVLHKIKVKEEAKDCCPTLIQQGSSAPVTVTSSSSPPPRIGAIATITISNCGSELAAVAKHTAGDAFPVDLDLKSRAKAQTCDKIPPREDANGTESRGSSSPSPSSSPSSQYAQPTKSQTARANSSSSARSPESDDQGATLQIHKSESQTSEDVTGAATNDHRLDEPKSETNGTSGARCISAIFTAHSKLRRLLGTLVQFATDISPDTGGSVKALVLNLLSGSLSAEEFHSALQEATNFPLRGFVLPYLKHNLPSLQRDLSTAARTDNQTCTQYLRANESAILEAVGLTESAVELFAPPPPPTVVSSASLHHHHYASAMRPLVPSAASTPAPSVAAHLGFAAAHGLKRRASDALYYENGAAFDEGPPYAKRSANPWTSHSHHHNQQPQQHHHLAHLSHHQQQQQQQQSAHPDTAPYCWYTQPLHSSVAAAAVGHPLVPNLVQAGASYGPLTQSQSHLPPSHQPTIAHGSTPASSSASAHSGSDDEWKNIHVMLNCILGMVEKTKRALAILQKRGCTSPAAPATGASSATSSLQAPTPAQTNGAQSNGENATAADRDGTFKRLSGEIVAQTIRATEDRVAEVKRRAEEAVQEVKRAAMAEVQRAVAAAMAESRATERLRSQRYLDNLPLSQQQQQRTAQQVIRPNSFLRLAETTASSARTAGATSAAAAVTATSSSSDDVDKEPHLGNAIGSSCWNCGRAALETCGGCGIARYCGSFCQHRDWEAGGHHATCRSTSSSTEQHQQAHQERGGSTTPSPPRTGSAASDSDVTKTATSSTSSASSVRSVK
ncbi:protein CBFA2T3 isoform X1 [Phymastichus coffea]|uniref:protein CBFA2T3 isoform X1 n=1 Tax=Phymastichus coffea TaxID=108790 RepID=UPI00273A7F04|nr:protein CBFA2T3 isoform X1 [Phymastichus coffea]XP_058789984.1 protein CBFA2T3 isoform X1 [Phymastichus coffea]XP_058789985.1 protein CBFA2T3 isoform X1 [Phymastichus coffea]